MTEIATPGPLATVANALTARLQIAFPPKLFTHQIMPGKVSPTVWRALTRKTPFIGLGWNEIQGGGGGRLFNGPASWTVFLVTKNESGVLGRFYGDAHAPGLFAMVEAATALLHGFTVPDFGSVSVDRASNVAVEGWDDDAMAVAAIDVSVKFTLKLADALLDAAPDVGEFKKLGIDWNFGGDPVLSDIDQVRT